MTVLWCYLRNPRVQDRRPCDYYVGADLTGQANHLGVTIEADIIKQKMPENNGGYNALEELRQDAQEGLHRADPRRSPDRADPLSASPTATWAASA